MGYSGNLPPFALPQNFIDEHDISEQNSLEDSNNESMEARPVLGLNLKDYFLKRHLVDQ